MNVSMSINPDDTEIWVVPGVATNGTYCQAAKNKYKIIFKAFCLAVDLETDNLS